MTVRAFLSAALFCALFYAPVRGEPLGDYGRPEYSPFVDEFLPWLKEGWLDLTGQAVPTAPFTDDEKLLRDRAYIIILPIEQRERSRLTFAGVDFVVLWTLIRNQPLVHDPRSYGNHLIAKAYRSHSARYAQLIDDIRADMGLVGPFFATAQRVLDADGVRQKSFRYVSPGLAGKIEVARERVDENRILIATVHRRYRERIASYRYALETLLVMTPSPAAVEAERVLRLLEERFARVTEPAPLPAGALVRK
jgi:hypothetical protein